jgi:adenosyl cobinamide kinase/adenosyl cobinamide phosphate guanylyltransferase
MKPVANSPVARTPIVTTARRALWRDRVGGVESCVAGSAVAVVLVMAGLFGRVVG